MTRTPMRDARPRHWPVPPVPQSASGQEGDDEDHGYGDRRRNQIPAALKPLPVLLSHRLGEVDVDKRALGADRRVAIHQDINDDGLTPGDLSQANLNLASGNSRAPAQAAVSATRSSSTVGVLKASTPRLLARWRPAGAYQWPPDHWRDDLLNNRLVREEAQLVGGVASPYAGNGVSW